MATYGTRSAGGATPLPDSANWRRSFQWPVETENYLNWIRVKAVNKGKAAAEAKVALNPQPAEEPKKRVEFTTAGQAHAGIPLELEAGPGPIGRGRGAVHVLCPGG